MLFVLLSLVLQAGAQTSPNPMWPSGYTLPPPANELGLQPNDLLLGGLFPLTGRLRTGGIEREAAARFAVDQINAKKELLPKHRLRLINFDTLTDEKESTRLALALCDQYKVLGLIGEAASVNSQAVALIADIYNTPQISYASTAVALSDKNRYPTFFRTCPSDAFQAQALLAICLRENWKRVTIYHVIDVYGTSLNTDFQALAGRNGIKVAHTIPILTSGTASQIEADLKQKMGTLDPKFDKIFIIFGFVADAGRVLRIANDMGLVSNKHQYLATDGIMQAGLLDAIATSEYSGANLTEPQLAERARRTKLATGLIGTGPAQGASPLTQQYLDGWWAANSSVYVNSGVPGRSVNVFSPYSYDAVYVYANAFKRLIDAETPINITTVYEALKATDTIGVTGPITFDANQDRLGATYTVFNFRLNNGTTALDTIGNWSASTNLQFGKAPQWTVNALMEAPNDAIECNKLQVVIEGTCRQCNTTDFFVEETQSCRPCPTGQQQNADQTGCVLNGGLIAAVVIIVVLVALIIIIGLALFIKKRLDKQKKLEEASATAPASTWEAADERSECAELPESASGVISTIDRSATYSVAMQQGEVPTFRMGKGQRMPVNETLSDVIIISNRGNQPIRYTVYVPAGNNTFECQTKPGVGVVKAKSEKQLTLTFKLLQTMKVDRRIKIQIDQGGSCYLPLRFEGEVSQRLDPDEIELFGKPIGDGAFGTVYRGRYRGTAVAVKVLRRQNEVGNDQNNNFLKEIDLFQKLRNPYIVNFIGASYIPGKLCLCTELLERGTVLELLQKAKISLALKMKLMLDTACAVEFLHQNGVMYRDLKPDNLLVFSVSHNANVNCKLSDFGTARTVEDPSALVQYSTGIGTPIYMAPELMSAAKYNCKVDVYSFAMVAWELMAEKQPFHEVKRVWDLPRIVVEGLRPAIDEAWPRQMQRMIADCWMQSHERRPVMKEVTAMLTEMFEKERKVYEKAKRTKRRDDDEDGPSASATARTGNLEALIEQGMTEMPTEIKEGELKRAEDARRDDDDVEIAKTEAAPKKKKKAKASAESPI